MADSGGGPSDVGTVLILIAMVGGIIYTILPRQAAPAIVNPTTQLSTTTQQQTVPTQTEAATTTEY